MFDDITFLIFLALGLLLVGPIFGIVALARASGLRNRLTILEREVAAMRAGGPTPLPEPVLAREAASPPPSETRVAEPPLPSATEEPDSSPPASEPPPSPEPQPEPAPSIEPAPFPPRRKGDLERRLAQHWLVWLGAGTLCLGGIFMAAYAVEAGFLGPLARLVLATLFGFLLIGLALRTRKGELARGALDLVPAALAAGGLVTLFGATVAAHAFYDYLAATLALALMAAVSLAAILLSLLFGPLTAILGCLGAYTAPFLIQSADTSLLGLSLYLAVVAIVMHSLSRWADWRWLAAENAILALGTCLGLFILFYAYEADGQGPLALIPGGLSLAVLAAPLALNRKQGPDAHRLGRPGRLILQAAFLLCIVVLVAAYYSLLPLFCLTLPVLVALLVAWSGRAEAKLATIAAAAALLAAALYQIPPDLLSPDGIEPPIVFEATIWLVPAAGDLAVALTLISAVFALAGYSASRRQGEASLYWAGLAVAVPLLALVIACWRLEGFGPSSLLSLAALALAALALLAAKVTPDDRAARAAWITGGFGALALGAAFILREEWLLVALSALLPILAYVAGRLDVPALRRPAMALTLAILAAAAWILNTNLYGGLGWFWALYGLGVPLALVFTARRLFAAVRIDLLVELLDAAILLLWLLFVTYATRTLIGQPGMELGLAEAGLQVSVWLAGALALLRLKDMAEGRHVLAYAWRIKLTLAAAEFAIVCLYLENPLLTGQPILGWPILNVLALAYLLPALLTAGIARALRRREHHRPAVLAGALAILVGLFWIALEVKRSIGGPELASQWGPDEQLALSLAWLLLSGVLLLIGIWRRDRTIRAGALAVACLAIGKAFLFDLSELEGLYRAASFVGLGLALIGIGWLYGRFVTTLPFAPGKQQDPGSEEQP
ncbi:Uncharacterized membrane protein [Arboricoccus pini]|uniref:Uncharacterized membrane protein n=1 Tax=Arboricoccus pini TaxID=1963835 RepID=A0A212QRH1_9PROT|nr:DUF2339 domain-containing protein [Arboricoccus pini]SNB62107.1 Uncharacterized membrane protein [Arboricoccus pini]